MNEETKSAYVRWQNSASQSEVWARIEAKDKATYYDALGKEKQSVPQRGNEPAPDRGIDHE